ncbi:MAG: hypothetical protein RLW61_02505 [Gammaproteobacteria bacterium]
MTTNPIIRARAASRCALALLCLGWFGAAPAASLNLLFDASLIDHYPGPDGLVGTADDVVTDNLTLSNSEPNTPGALSYDAFDFVGSGAVTDPGLPPGHTAVTFLGGEVGVDTAVAAGGGGPLITSLEVGGTQPFIGHGPYDAAISAVNGGTYDPATGAFTLDIDFVASLVGGTANAVNFSLTGPAWYIEASAFGAATGDAYVDDVLLPLAQATNAGALFFARASGVVPASTGGTGGGFPSMPVEAVIVATTPIPLPAAGWLLGAALAVVGARRRRPA